MKTAGTASSLALVPLMLIIKYHVETSLAKQILVAQEGSGESSGNFYHKNMPLGLGDSEVTIDISVNAWCLPTATWPGCTLPCSWRFQQPCYG